MRNKQSGLFLPELARNLLLLSALAGAYMGCSLAQRQIAKDTAISAALDCAAPVVVASTVDLMIPVSDILRKGGADWQAELEKLKTRGMAALTCTVAKVVEGLARAVPGPGAPQTEPNEDDRRAVTRGQEWLKGRK